MKRVYSLMCLLLAELALFGQGDLSNSELQNSMSVLYEEWHNAIAERPYLNETSIIQTNAALPRLSKVITEIYERNVEMALFLCEKVAREKAISYYDGILLSEVAGMYWLIVPGTPQHEQNIEENLRKMSLLFSQEWSNGKYSNIADNVRKICEQLASKQINDEIQPMDLIPLRRYGIFAIPELVRQIRLNNSSHAFATLLIVTREKYKYSEYIKGFLGDCNTREEKVKEAKSGLIRFLRIGKNQLAIEPLMAIQAAIGE